jgi:hypothetical protein
MKAENSEVIKPKVKYIYRILLYVHTIILYHYIMLILYEAKYEGANPYDHLYI